MTRLALFVVTASVILAQATALSQAPSSNYEHLKEYGEAIVGEWVSEVDVDFDYPPIVKKGDKATVKVINQWILNENAISSQFTAEVNGIVIVSGQGLIGWDKSAGRIVECGFDSLGGRGEGIVEKRDDKWYESGMGVAPDGKVGSGTSIVTILDNDTHEILEIGRVGPQGEVLPNQKITSKRVQTN
jgi:hypothetical protein